MADLLHQVRRTIRRYDLLRDGMALVVGVSGGPDSLCLLHLLGRLAPEMELRLHVAHLNHGLRGADADADADFMAEFAAGRGVPYTVGRAEVAGLAREAGLSLEEAARQARYRFLADVATDVGADAIAVGHNADDQAETVLMHFLRGSGVAGLRGMLPKTPLGEFRLSGEAGERRSGGERGSGGAEAPLFPSSPLSPTLIRPLLATPRVAIEAYCAEHGLQPRFDRSNEDTTIYRNRLRHELLPLLEGYNPRIREVLAHTAEVLGGDHELLRTAVDEAWDRVRTHERANVGVREWENGRMGDFPHSPTLPLSHSPARSFPPSSVVVDFDLAAWRALPLGLQRATIREAIHRLRASLRNINWEHVERAVWLAREGTTGQKATLAAGLELEIDYRTLRIGSVVTPVSTLQQASLFQPDSSPGVLVAPGVTVIGGWQIAISCARRDAQPGDFGTAADPWTARLDADAVGSGLILRIRQPGDRFQPQGLDGHSTKLNEFMINARIPKDARASWPLLCSTAGIAWVCGLRVAEWAIVRPETRAIWVVRLMSVPRS